jgi:hypothetical protein
MSRDPRISPIFYYFEQHTDIRTGRTVGRKIGDVQEVLCKKLLLASPKIADSIMYAQKLEGQSGATHNVEFVLFQPVMAANLAPGQKFQVLPNLSLSVGKINVVKQAARVMFSGDFKKAAVVKSGRNLKIGEHLEGSTLLVKIVHVDASIVRLSVIDLATPVGSIESKRVGAQRFSKSSKLGSGIQTIEKAKQASLAAIDFDLKFNGTLLLHQSNASESRAFKSFVVLGNGVHWTENDLAILETYVDYTYLATDEAMLRYAEFIRTLAAKEGKDFFPYFMGYFSGLLKTPPDDFAVTEADFVSVRPKDALPLVQTVEAQVQPYPVIAP